MRCKVMCNKQLLQNLFMIYFPVSHFWYYCMKITFGLLFTYIINITVYKIGIYKACRKIQMILQ